MAEAMSYIDNNSVGIFASVGPFVPETVEKVAAPVRRMWENAPRMPGLFRVQMKVFAWLARTFPNLYIKMILAEFSETDRKNYARLKLADLLRPDRNEGDYLERSRSGYDLRLRGHSSRYGRPV